MHPGVLLLHTLPDGSSHYDWMIRSPDGHAGNTLITFRTAQRLDRLESGGFEAQRLQDHREAYLTYEGALSGGRGHVRRIAQGQFEIEIDTPERFQVRGGFEGRQLRMLGRHAGEGRWLFGIDPA